VKTTRERLPRKNGLGESYIRFRSTDNRTDSYRQKYVPVVLFIMLYKVVLTLSLQMMFLTVTVEIKAVDQKFLPLLCLLLK